MKAALNKDIVKNEVNQANVYELELSVIRVLHERLNFRYQF